MNYDQALKLLASAAGWTQKETENDPDSALWKANEPLVEARNVIRDGKARGLHS